MKLSTIRSKPTAAGAEPTVATAMPYRGELITVQVDTVSLPNGKEAIREIVSHPSSVCIVPVDCQGNVLLVRQYRKAVESFLLEAPAGKMESGENPDTTALRELQEEIGHTANYLQGLGAFYVAPGWCTQMVHTYLATDLVQARLEADDDEFIEVIQVPWTEILDKIASGEIRDAKSVTALLLAMRVLGDN